MRSKVGGVKYRGMIQTAIGIAKEEVREIIVIIQVISNLTAWFTSYCNQQLHGQQYLLFDVSLYFERLFNVHFNHKMGFCDTSFEF